MVSSIVAFVHPGQAGTTQILNCINNAKISINTDRNSSISGIADGNTTNLISDKNLNLGTLSSVYSALSISGLIRNSNFDGAIMLSNSINSGLIIDISTVSNYKYGTGGIASVLFFPQNNYLKKLLQCINTGVIINNSNANPPRIIKGIAHTPN